MKSYRDNRISGESLLLTIDFLNNSEINISLIKLKEYPQYLEILTFMSLIVGYFIWRQAGSLTSNILLDYIIIFSIVVIISLRLRISAFNYYARYIDHNILTNRLLWNRTMNIIVDPNHIEFENNKNVKVKNLGIIGIGKFLLDQEHQQNLKKYSTDNYRISCTTLSQKRLDNFLEKNREKNNIIAFINESLEVIPIVPLEFLTGLGSERHRGQMNSVYKKLIYTFPGLFIFEKYRVDSGGVFYQGLIISDLKLDWVQNNMELLIKYHGKKIKNYCDNIA